MDSIANQLGLTEFVDEAKRAAKRPRQALHQLLNVACIILTAFVFWRLLMVATNCESPVVVVLSGSMEPGMYRGDILFLNNPEIFNPGDIIVYKVENRDIPIVHRIVSVHEPTTGDTLYLTKGDNNEVDDRGLYSPGSLWLKRSHIMGKAIGFIPTVGMVTIYLNDHPSIKYGLLGLMGILLMMGKDV